MTNVLRSTYSCPSTHERRPNKCWCVTLLKATVVHWTFRALSPYSNTIVVLPNDKALISPPHDQINMYNTHHGKILLGCKTVICILNIHTKFSHLVSSLFYQLKCIKKKLHFCLDQIVASKQTAFGNPWTCPKEKKQFKYQLDVVEGTHMGWEKKNKKGCIISSPTWLCSLL